MVLTPHAKIEFPMQPVRISAYLHSELSQRRYWERDVTKPGGREVENKAEPKPSCHSATGVLTIIGCHHFLIRPVSKKFSGKTARQKEHPHVAPHCGYWESCYLCGPARTRSTPRRANTSNMSESATYPKNKTDLVTQNTVRSLWGLLGYPPQTHTHSRTLNVMEYTLVEGNVLAKQYN